MVADDYFMRNRSYTKVFVLGATILFGFLVYLQYRLANQTVPAFEPTVDGERRETNGVVARIEMERIVEGGPGSEQIPSINQPEFESVASANTYLDDAGMGIVLTLGGSTRFYPYQVLVWHEVVNDTMDGRSILVSYSPLTNTPAVYERSVNADVFVFDVTGKLYNNNALYIDRATHSLWQQSTGMAVVGEKIDTTLERIPSTVVSWGVFRSTYPNGSVLSRQTGVTRDYTRDPYGAYATNNTIEFPINAKDDRFHPKTVVYGVDTGSDQKAYLSETLKKQTVLNEHIGPLFALVVYDETLGTVRAFDRVVGPQELTFQGEKDVLVDTQTGSRWNLGGKAFSGALQGERLREVPIQQSYWFSWFATHPSTQVHN